MKPIFLSILCLALWQCSNRDTSENVPEPVDKTDKTVAVAAPFIITAGNVIGWDIALDAANNIYVTGSYFGTTTFGTTSQTAAGNNDVFVAKYKSDGTLQWVKSFGDTSNDEGRGIAVDGSGNVYVTGDYYGTISLGNTSVSSAGSADVFIAKYNADGDPQWVRSAGSDGGERGHDLALDGAGNVYVTGEFQGTGIFGNTSRQAAGEFDLFVAKYNTDGAFQWVQSAGGSQRETGYGIIADAKSGDVYVTGAYFGTTTFGNTTKTSEGDADVFFAKYNTDGVFQWMQSAGGSGTDAGRDVAVDDLGNVYVTGQTYGQAEPGNGGFLTKYNSNGNAQWGQPLKFSSEGLGVTTDPLGNAYVVSSSSTIFKYNSEGMLLRAQLPRSSDVVSGWGIAVNHSDKLYITGFYKGTLTFGEISQTAAGVRDMFVIGGDL